MRKLCLFISILLFSQMTYAENIGVGDFPPNKANKIKVSNFETFFNHPASPQTVQSALEAIAASWPVVAPVELTTDLVPATTCTYDLGSSINQWQSIYVNDTASAPVVDTIYIENSRTDEGGDVVFRDDIVVRGTDLTIDTSGNLTTTSQITTPLIETAGTTGILSIQPDATGEAVRVKFFENCATGDRPELWLYGYADYYDEQGYARIYMNTFNVLNFRGMRSVLFDSGQKMTDDYTITWGSGNDVDLGWIQDGVSDPQYNFLRLDMLAEAANTSQTFVITENGRGVLVTEPPTVTGYPTLDIHSGAGSGTQLQRLRFYHDTTDGQITSLAGDLYLTATGGDINLNDDNLTTTGIVGFGKAPTAGVALDIEGVTSADQLRLGSGGVQYYKMGRHSTTGFFTIQGTQSGFTGYTFKSDDGSTLLEINDAGNFDFIAGNLTTTGTISSNDIDINAAGPDISLIPTVGDTFGFHVEPTISQSWWSNETDGVHYIFADTDHTLRFGRTGQVPKYSFGSGSFEQTDGTFDFNDDNLTTTGIGTFKTAIITDNVAAGDVPIHLVNQASDIGLSMSINAWRSSPTAGRPMGRIVFEHTSNNDSSMFFYTADSRANHLALTIDSDQNFDFEDGNITTTGNVNIDSDSGGLYLGDGQDYKIYGSATDLIINSENVTTNDEVHFTNFDAYTFDNKVAFTQVDLNEYIDSLNDGYMDYGATTAHRFNTPVRGATSLWYNEYHLGASQTSPGASGAAEVELNGIFSWNLDAITEYLYYAADIHDDWDAATDVEIEVTGYLGEAETANDLIRMSVLCNYGTDHDNANTFKTQTLTTDHDIGALNAQGSVHKIPFTFNFDEDGNVLEVLDVLHLRVYLDDVTTAPVVTDFNITFVTIKYKSATVRIEVD